MLKINSKIIIYFIWLFVICLLIYSRFINLGWGLPYPMHPDERNMANALQQLQCNKFSIFNFQFSIQDCFNPHFFAYGHLPLYLGYLGILGYKLSSGKLATPITFEEAVMALRVISAVASIINVFVLLKIVDILFFNFQFAKKFQFANFLIFTFSPFFIQFSHFGTTESFLMLLYSLIVYKSIQFLRQEEIAKKDILFLSLIAGVSIATKVSSVIFLIIPLLAMVRVGTNSSRPWLSWPTIFFKILTYLVIPTFVFSIIFSPHNFISFSEFLGSMRYESDVALGSYRAFYTRQFEGTIPVLFQLEKIFPYALGWPVFLLGILGILGLSWKRKEINLLRLAILVYFLPNTFLYAKWTRFIAPILPLMLVFAILFIFEVIPMKMGIYKIKQYFWIPVFAGMTMLMIVPGLAYLSIYQNPDVRFTASEWIYKNIPSRLYVLSETANVVDLPIPTFNIQHPTSNYQYVSFNFYDLDENPFLQIALKEHLAKADYIFVSSRRIFANHLCTNDQLSMINNQSIINNQLAINKKKCEYLRKKYPLLNDYYSKLFSGELGFEKVAEFSSYPKIQLFDKTVFEFPDEQAEETWTVFDHPVMRIYKRI